MSGSKDHEIRIWDCNRCRCLAVGTGHVAAVSAVALSKRISQPGKLAFAASAGADKLLKVWDLNSCVKSCQQQEQQQHKLEQLRVTAAVVAHDKDINSVAVAPNDSLLATGSQDRTAKVG